MIHIKDNRGRFHELDYLVFHNKVFSYVYKGSKLIWSTVSKIWRDHDRWKDNDIWKY